MLNALRLLTACSFVSGGHAATTWQRITDVGQLDVSSLGTEIKYLNDGDGSLRIALSFENYGCGDTANFFAALITDSSGESTWDRIRYRMDFYGTTICYSIFDNTWYGDSPWSGDNICGGNGQKFGLFPFDHNIDLIENGLTIGDAWTGRTRHCGGDTADNLWIGDEGGHRNYDGFVKVELRRNPVFEKSGLYVGASCTIGGIWMDGIDFPVDAVFSEIQVGYDDEQQFMDNRPAQGFEVKEPAYYIVKVTSFDIWCFVGVALVCLVAVIGCGYRQRTPVSYGKVAHFTESDVENERLK